MLAKNDNVLSLAKHIIGATTMDSNQQLANRLVLGLKCTLRTAGE